MRFSRTRPLLAGTSSKLWALEQKPRRHSVLSATPSAQGRRRKRLRSSQAAQNSLTPDCSGTLSIRLTLPSRPTPERHAKPSRRTVWLILDFDENFIAIRQMVFIAQLHVAGNFHYRARAFLFPPSLLSVRRIKGSPPENPTGHLSYPDSAAHRGFLPGRTSLPRQASYPMCVPTCHRAVS